MNVQEKLQEYYRHDGRKMKNFVDKILTTYDSISQKDYDDFYSVANETVAKAILGYDDTRNFDTYIYSCIANKIKTEMIRRNRFKRMADRTSVSIDIVKCPQKHTRSTELKCLVLFLFTKKP